MEKHSSSRLRKTTPVGCVGRDFWHIFDWCVCVCIPCHPFFFPCHLRYKHQTMLFGLYSLSLCAWKLLLSYNQSATPLHTLCVVWAHCFCCVFCTYGRMRLLWVCGDPHTIGTRHYFAALACIYSSILILTHIIIYIPPKHTQWDHMTSSFFHSFFCPSSSFVVVIISSSSSNCHIYDRINSIYY